MIIAFYVDHLIISSSNDKIFDKLKTQLQSSFQMKDLGNVNYCLGMNFSQRNSVIKINQKRYIENVFKKM